MASIDLISCLITDELTRPARTAAQTGRTFRRPNKTLDNFYFTFNPKMNRNLVFDLATSVSSLSGKTNWSWVQVTRSSFSTVSSIQGLRS
jgi:hypothetical protein